MDSIYFAIFLWIAVVVIIIAAIVAVIASFLRKRRGPVELSDRNWYLQIALSRGDALSQWFLVLGGLALANTIYVINQNLGAPLSWQTILLLAGLIFVACGYLAKSVYAAVIGVVGLLVWWVAQTGVWSLPYHGDASLVVTAVPVGLVWLAIFLYAAGFIQGKFLPYKRFAVSYTFIGIFLATVILFNFSTRSGLESLETMIERSSLFDVWQNLVSIFVIGIVATITLAYGWADKRISTKEVAACAVIFLLFGALLVLPSQNIFFNSTQELSDTGILWAAIINFALFFEILGVIFSGYLRKELWLVNLGTIFLLVFVAVKYFDWFFNFMDKSVFFLIAGLLLFGVGWTMERGRRFLVKSINS